MIDTRRTAVPIATAATLVLALACTVGEAQPGPPSPGSEQPGDTGAVAGAGVGAEEPGAGVEPADAGTRSEAGRAEDLDEYRAMDLLIRAQLAYEAARLPEALTLADRVLKDYPESGAVEAARWVGARVAYSMDAYRRAREMALEYADRQPADSRLAEQARELAELAEDGLAEPAGEPAVIGVILPRSGPRVLVRYADWVLKGIEMAVSEMEEQRGRPIDLVVADDSGGTRTRAAVAELERRGALAIIGPLLPQELPVAAGARRDSRMVLVSPTATRPPRWPETYSVRTGDTRGAQQLGRYAADVGLRQGAVLFARGAGYERKAQAFAVEYETLGGDVKAMVPYDSGTTTFGSHMNRILEAVAPPDTATVDTLLVDSLVALGYLPDRATADTMTVDSLLVLVELLAMFDTTGVDTATEPVDSGLPYDTSDPWLGQIPQKPFALFVAAPVQDVPKIAPQVAFYDLDSAGVQVFGDEAWASAGVRRVVPGRDLEGVIAASHFPPDRAAGAADPAFVELYETRYRQSLDNVLPALGYDAANLVLQALPNRRLTPDALARRFGFLAAIRGATGLLSVRAGQVVRTPYLVTIHRGELEPAPFPWDYALPEPLPPTPPDTTELEGEGEEEDLGR